MEEQVVVVAAIDCGSNSTRLLISEVKNGELNKLYKTHKVTKTSEGMQESGNISLDSKKRLFQTLRTYLKEIEKYETNQILCIGTAVFRDAENSEEIIEEIKQKFKLEMRVITGEEEGQLTSVGVLSDSTLGDNLLIVDIGGRSTEIIYDEKNKINVNSLNIGVVSLNESFLKQNPITPNEEKLAVDFINSNLEIFEDFSNRSFVGVAGTFTSVASIFLEQKKYNEDGIHLKNIDYGYERVTEEEKTDKVGAVFDSVSQKYDLMNDLMSLGLHRFWKRFAMMHTGLTEGMSALDVAGGTGDLASSLCQQVGKKGTIVLTDINFNMLINGRSKLLDQGKLNQINLIQSNAESLPFVKDSFR